MAAVRSPSEPSRRWPLAVALGVLLVGSCLAIWGLGYQDRVSSDRYDVRNDALRDVGIEGHAKWAIDMLNGAPVSVSEIEQRLSPRFLLQITAQDFLITTRLLAQEGPFEQRGFETESDAGLEAVRSALQAADGQVYDFSLVWDPFSPNRIQGMTIQQGDSDRGPFSPIDALAHLVGAWGLAGAGVVLWLRASRRLAGTLLLGAALLWLAQFLELANASILYTIGLVAGPLAAVVVVAALLALGDDPFDRLGIVTMLLAALAALASMASLLVIDTSISQLPDQLLATTHNADTAKLLAVLEQTMAIVAAACLAAVLWVRRLRSAGDRSNLALMLAVVGSMIGAVVIGVAIWGLRGSHHDLSQSPILSLAALLIPAGIGFETVREDNARLQELVVTELRSSRSRIVESAERARREVERDLHDGAQQRLIALQLSLKLEQQRAARTGDSVDVGFLHSVSDELGGAIDELRELGRGLRPSALDHGLRTAVDSLAERSPLPIVTNVAVERSAPAIESAAYFVINEAVSNATRHSGADHIRVTTTLNEASIEVEVADDGGGGAGKRGGIGLQSLEDRVVALGGTLVIESPVGTGTRIVATLPLNGTKVEHG